MSVRLELNQTGGPIRLLALSSRAQDDETGRKRPGRAYWVGVALISLLTTGLIGWLLYRWLAQPLWIESASAVFYETMLLLETAGAFTLAFLWAALGSRYWLSQREQDVSELPPLSLEKLKMLSPRAFERYVAGLFRQKGYRVVVRGSSGDLGVDLEVTGPSGRRAIVQCKRYQNTVGAEVVRELFGTLVHEGAMRAFLVTTADISQAAREWAADKPITLIDGETLLQIATSLRQAQHTGVA